MRGKFIVFEGIDGCGKGTQLKLAASYLFDKNKDNDLYLTREPTKDFHEIRERMSKGNDVTKDVEWYTQMFVEDRRNHVKKYINPALENGIHVLCDRYKYSTLAYQQTQGMCLKSLINMHKGLIVPDLVLIYDCDPEIAFNRRKNDGATDVFDKDLEFQRRLRENYLKLKDILKKENIQIINSNFSIEDIFCETKFHITSIFRNI